MNNHATTLKNITNTLLHSAFKLSAVALVSLSISTAIADETCLSPYMPKIKGQEDFVYIWTLGV